MTASHWEHIYPLEKLFCLILIFRPVIVKKSALSPLYLLEMDQRMSHV